jgi:hypothetical protein
MPDTTMLDTAKANTVAPSGTVHWLGTGLSTGSGLRLVCNRAERVIVWGRTVAKAERRLAALGLTGRAEMAAFDLPALAGALAAGDIVVSMLPTTEHVELLRLCMARRAHFACTSYVSEGILAAAATAEQAGIVVLTETGLDPGIDHLFAHRLVAQAREAVGDAAVTAEFTSYCGGVPAVPNDFRYRFSWAPKGVLTALCSAARFIDEGVERTVGHPWTATRQLKIGAEIFEVYPNRDSIPFVEQYGIPSTWRLDRFVRGTLRLHGWLDAWQPVFAELRHGDGDRIAALAEELAVRYPTTDTDHDRVVLSVALHVRGADGLAWQGEHLLDLIGDATETAMARTVSVPLALGVSELLAGSTAPGLHRAVEDVERLLEHLGIHGISGNSPREEYRINSE